MPSLTGNQIKNSYAGLLKTNDNGIIPATGFGALITDGDGNQSPLNISQEGVNIYSVGMSTITNQNSDGGLYVDATESRADGVWNFQNAQVTGLPNTTYDLAATQDGVNVDITLTGSDASVDTVQLTAGTNITLTETAGSITIDASGGGGGFSGGVGAGGAVYGPYASDYATYGYTQPLRPLIPGYSGGTCAVLANVQNFAPVTLTAGMYIDTLAFFVKIAGIAGSDLKCAIYDAKVVTFNTQDYIAPSTILLDFGTESLDITTTGSKQITGYDYTLPPSSVGNNYFISWAYSSGGGTLSLSAIFGIMGSLMPSIASFGNYLAYSTYYINGYTGTLIENPTADYKISNNLYPPILAV